MSEKKTVPDAYVAEEGMANLWNVWYKELHDDQSGLTIKIDRILESVESEFQRIACSRQTVRFRKQLLTALR